MAHTTDVARVIADVFEDPTFPERARIAERRSAERRGTAHACACRADARCCPVQEHRDRAPR